MIYSILELIWFFISYSFLGWILETTATAFKKRQFAKKGLINGPFCIIYGSTAVLLTIYTVGLSVFWLFLGSMILATVIEWLCGHFIEKHYHERWWDYSDIRLNLDGYICVPMSVFWGLLGVLAVRIGNPVLAALLHLLPSFLGRLLVFFVLGVLILDIVATLVILSGRSRAQEKWQTADDRLTEISTRFGRWICRRVELRIQKAYPGAKAKSSVQSCRSGTVFAEGCNFYKIFLLFVVGSFLGDLVETVFCRITMGEWMSRSSLVWGPFSVVWGLGIAAVTVLLYRYREKSDSFLFCMGVLLGGTYEYICSVFTEIVFGKIFWDYSEIPFNLGGRINLLYCFFWGIAAVIWFKKLYVIISGFIEKWPMKTGKIITWVLVAFMACNMIVSSMALVRYDERSMDVPAERGWQKTMDERFGDERMMIIYPKAQEVR